VLLEATRSYERALANMVEVVMFGFLVLAEGMSIVKPATAGTSRHLFFPRRTGKGYWN
jgi:hypothetical protein